MYLGFSIKGIYPEKIKSDPQLIIHCYSAVQTADSDSPPIGDHRLMAGSNLKTPPIFDCKAIGQQVMQSDQDPGVVVADVRYSEAAVDLVGSPHVAPKSCSNASSYYLSRLKEVNFIEAKIALELEKEGNPCEGFVSRELLELELEALGRDRIAFEKRVASLSCFPELLVPSSLSSSSSSSVAGG